MTIIFGDKNTASRKPTKIFKNQGQFFLLLKRMQRAALVSRRKRRS
jgi:hypothetical protein